MRILVTGATGTVGSEVVKQLAAAGQKVRAFVHSPNKADKIKSQNIEIARGDYAKPETLRAALKGIEKVFLLCSMGPDQPKLESNVIEEARKAGVTHVVKQSGMLAPMEQDFIVARWNRAAEKKLESSGMAWTHLRANGFMSFILDLAGTIKGEGAFYLPGGDGKYSLVDPRDIAAVAVQALTENGHEGKACTITGPEDLSFADIADRLSLSIGKRVRYVNIPDDAFKKGMTGMGMPEVLADAIIEVFGAIRTGRLSGIAPVVEQITGRKPRSFDAWARENAGAFK